MNNEPFDPLDEPPYKIKPEFYAKPNALNFLNYPKPKWSIEFAPNCFIHTSESFNWFHRFMQSWILGFKWKKLVDSSNNVV
jgi:hypothetical protein